MDEFRIYDAALAGNEVTALYKLEKPISAKNNKNIDNSNFKLFMMMSFYC